MASRVKTSYPGVYYREARRVGGKGREKVYYVVFKKGGKVFEEKVGSQYRDAMTPARAATIRGERIEGKRSSRKETREAKRAAEKAEASRWTIGRLWEHYRGGKGKYPGRRADSAYYHYLEPLAEKEPRNLLPLDVDRIRHGLTKKGKAPQTVKHVLALLGRITLYGVRKGLCQGLGFKIEKPRVNNLKTEDLTEEQLSRLMAAIDAEEDQEAATTLRLVLLTGIRRGECFKLRWDDIDFERSFITLRDPKGRIDQKIPLNDAARVLLGNFPRTESPYIFPNRRSGVRTKIPPAVNRIRKAAGLPKDFRPYHGLRHVYASMLASSGRVDLYQLQKLLTHKSPIMTQRYAHLRDDALRRAAGVASDIMGKAMAGAKAKARKKTA
jgi:integrase